MIQIFWKLYFEYVFLLYKNTISKVVLSVLVLKLPKFEKTPLHIIVEKRNIKITELLLSNEKVDAYALLKIFKSNISINDSEEFCNTVVFTVFSNLGSFNTRTDNTTFFFSVFSMVKNIDSCYKWKNFSEIE